MANVGAVSGTDQNAPLNGTPSTTSSSRSQMNMQSFLKILAAQMKNQNINSSSTDNSQYITEMTLFTAIQAINTMTLQSTKQYAASLVGKDVVLSVYDSSSGKKKEITGTVGKVSFNNTTGNSYLQIGNQLYDISDIVQVLGQHKDATDSGKDESGAAGTGGKTEST